MFKDMFCIKDIVLGEGEAAVKCTVISIPGLLSRFCYAAVGMVCGAKTDILNNNKFFARKVR